VHSWVCKLPALHKSLACQWFLSTHNDHWRWWHC
jgi:hypothetical protein